MVHYERFSVLLQKEPHAIGPKGGRCPLGTFQFLLESELFMSESVGSPKVDVFSLAGGHGPAVRVRGVGYKQTVTVSSSDYGAHTVRRLFRSG